MGLSPIGRVLYGKKQKEYAARGLEVVCKGGSAVERRQNSEIRKQVNQMDLQVTLAGAT